MSDGIREKLLDFFIYSFEFFVLVNIASWTVAALVTNTFFPDWRSFFFPAHFWFLPFIPQNIISFIFVYVWMLLARFTKNNPDARPAFLMFTLLITILILLFAITSNQLITASERMLIARDVVLGFFVPVLLLSHDKSRTG